MPQDQDRRLWFDPTQLPSFTGVVERYLINPEGKIDRLVFREGPQVILPDPVGTDVMAAVPVGKDIMVWGIRARQAPVITMLAWAPNAETPPRFVERPSWGIGGYHAGTEALQVEGEVSATLLTPQGVSMGAILADGTVLRLPPAVAQAVGDRLSAGRHVAAAGHGLRNDKGTAIDVERLGDTPQALQPLPAGQTP
ncbi:hypothetical protein [Roseomonas elaeocarpi]|uniref:Uncharacterized protein n=1 Tax=Roseomonas elaeocarpi TaxID=907779 RepID=A0ABV6K0Q0_9PROT